jgi:hypothetical protein
MANKLKTSRLPSSELSSLVARSFLMQLNTARNIVSLANRCEPHDESRAGCIRTVRRILEFSETRLWKLPLNPVAIHTISAEMERLRFQVDATS